MQKIVLDTNILVSSLIQKNYSYFIVNELVIEKRIHLCVSDQLMEEYYLVLKRKKFSIYPDFLNKAETLLAQIETISDLYFPKIKLNIIRDFDDNKLLELAFECKANFLITGNSNDFTMAKFGKTKVVTPREYWEKYHPFK